MVSARSLDAPIVTRVTASLRCTAVAPSAVQCGEVLRARIGQSVTCSRTNYSVALEVKIERVRMNSSFGRYNAHVDEDEHGEKNRKDAESDVNIY